MSYSATSRRTSTCRRFLFRGKFQHFLVLLTGNPIQNFTNFIFFSRADAQKDDAIEMLNTISESKRLAESAVADGDDTLKKANNTFHLLQSFQSEVQKSSESAKIALQDVPAISQQIIDTEEIIKQAEEVLN